MENLKAASYTITHYNLVHPPRRMYNAGRVAVIVQKPQAHWTITDTVSVLHYLSGHTLI